MDEIKNELDEHDTYVPLAARIKMFERGLGNGLKPAPLPKDTVGDLKVYDSLYNPFFSFLFLLAAKKCYIACHSSAHTSSIPQISYARASPQVSVHRPFLNVTYAVPVLANARRKTHIIGAMSVWYVQNQQRMLTREMTDRLIHLGCL